MIIFLLVGSVPRASAYALSSKVGTPDVVLTFKNPIFLGDNTSFVGTPGRTYSVAHFEGEGVGALRKAEEVWRKVPSEGKIYVLSPLRPRQDEILFLEGLSLFVGGLSNYEKGRILFCQQTPLGLSGTSLSAENLRVEFATLPWRKLAEVSGAEFQLFQEKDKERLENRKAQGKKVPDVDLLREAARRLDENAELLQEVTGTRIVRAFEYESPDGMGTRSEPVRDSARGPLAVGVDRGRFFVAFVTERAENFPGRRWAAYKASSFLFGNGEIAQLKWAMPVAGWKEAQDILTASPDVKGIVG